MHAGLEFGGGLPADVALGFVLAAILDDQGVIDQQERRVHAGNSKEVIAVGGRDEPAGEEARDMALRAEGIMTEENLVAESAAEERLGVGGFDYLLGGLDRRGGEPE